MASDAALLTAKFEDGRLELAAGGSWTAPHAAELETLVDACREAARRAKAVSIDMARRARVRHLWRLAARAAHPRLGTSAARAR